MADSDPRREAWGEWVFFRLVGDHDDSDSALGGDLAADLRHGELAIDGLAAGHGDGVIVEDLVGDVDLGGDGRPDRHQARMVVGAIPDILEDVLSLGKRRLADPARPLAAHLGVADIIPVHPLRHVMAADARARDAAVGDAGGRVVWAARAEIGCSQHRAGNRRFRLFLDGERAER